MNLNELAKEVTLREGLQQSISIAQIKEVLRILCDAQPIVVTMKSNESSMPPYNATVGPIPIYKILEFLSFPPKTPESFLGEEKKE